MSWLFSRVEKSAFHDKAWKRADLAEWDERWTHLSRTARYSLLDGVRTGFGIRTPNPLDNFPPAARGEWLAQRLISVEEARLPGHFVVAAGAVGWLNRMQAVRRYALLSELPSHLDRYVSHAFATFDLRGVITEVVEKQTGTARLHLTGDLVEMFVRRKSWPEWVADYLGDPLARPLLDAVEKAGAPVPLPRLTELLPGADPKAVRATFDRLVNHLALFEDLRSETLDVVTGLLPEVVRARLRARTEPVPRLEPARPAEVAPEAGIDVPALRAILREVAVARPRLKQDGDLYQKEEDRFVAALDPLPAWLLRGPDEVVRLHRLKTVLSLARQVEYVQVVKDSDRVFALELTPRGQQWLARDREGQYAVLFEELRAPAAAPVSHGTDAGLFLGSAVHAHLARPPQRDLSHYSRREVVAEQRLPLREAVYALFADLPHGTYFAVDSFLAWASHGVRNPLLLGRPRGEVVVIVGHQFVPPVDEHLGESARTLLRDLLTNRLIRLGCVQAARDEHGQHLFARLPRLEVYFGKAATAPAQAAAPTRVVVQPDFTIVVIGLDQGPVADLTPFCDRSRGRASAGSVTLRLSRASLFRGLAMGLKPEDVLARLRKHASNELPGNVVTEVQTWCGQARTVDVAAALVVSCPDADTAGRVVSVLGRVAQRVGDKAVALDLKSITPGVRQKLQAEGIFLGVVKGRK
jgi:hypothetical protein